MNTSEVIFVLHRYLYHEHAGFVKFLLIQQGLDFLSSFEYIYYFDWDLRGSHETKYDISCGNFIICRC